jgi:hypothetical protein
MATPVKTISYTLKKNKLQGRDTAPYTARIQSGRTVGQDEIIATMAKMNASVSRRAVSPKLIVCLIFLKPPADSTSYTGENVNASESAGDVGGPRPDEGRDHGHPAGRVAVSN